MVSSAVSPPESAGILTVGNASELSVTIKSLSSNPDDGYDMFDDGPNLFYDVTADDRAWRLSGQLSGRIFS